MWLPRLRFTLVPHSSRNQFWRIFFFLNLSFFLFSSFVWGFFFFCKFFSTKAQLHLCLTQAQGATVESWAGLGWRDPKARPVPAPVPSPAWGTARHGVPSALHIPALASPTRGVSPRLGDLGTPRCHIPNPGTFPRSHKCLGPFVIGLIKAKPDLSFGVFIFSYTS